MSKYIQGLVASLLVLVGLVAAPSVAQDRHSYAQLEQISTPHLELAITIDFAAKQIAGTATYQLQRNSDAQQLHLDSSELSIEKVEIGGPAGWQETSFQVAQAHPSLGSEVVIEVGSEATEVKIYYHTSPSASGLQWLTPAQTAGKQHPFMFSQSQPIHARSWIPIQDTPALRLTYNAAVTTPAGLLAVMSADNSLSAERSGQYSFSMPQPIPPYLIAIAAGDLQSKAISDNVAVFAEAYILDDAVWEFADTPTMIDVTEAMYGPYRWDRYDLLILPPSFPFGGMENPRLSFITPTVIAKDRSLVSLIAHELAHSWSGNLVTNATWRDLWINEGFTSYVENRIMEELFGKERAQMELALGYQDLQGDLASLPAADTVMHIDIGLRHPDEVFSQVPYVKGQLFLVYLEQQFGREVFDQFLRQYFADFAFKSITTAEIREYLLSELVNQHSSSVTAAKIDEWLYQPGLPADAPQPTSDAFAQVEQQMMIWLKGGMLRTADWTTHEWLHFINNLPLDISAVNMARLDREFQLTQSQNNEIAHAWLKLAIIENYEPAQQRLRSYLLSIGRNKLVSPLYRELARTPAGLAWAQAVYQQAKAGYHPLTQTVAEGILYPQGDK